MAQIICPGCGTRMEDNGVPCPLCGFKQDPDFKKKVLQFITLFAILGALFLSMLILKMAPQKDAPAVRDATGKIVTTQ